MDTGRVIIVLALFIFGAGILAGRSFAMKDKANGTFWLIIGLANTVSIVLCAIGLPSK